jgi:hypothetical protein
MERATVRQKKTGRPVRFELTEQPGKRSMSIFVLPRELSLWRPARR